MKAYFDEEQMLAICKKYGIEVVEKEGYPLYKGKEMEAPISLEELEDAFSMDLFLNEKSYQSRAYR